MNFKKLFLPLLSLFLFLLSSGIIKLIPDYLWFDSFGFSDLWVFVFSAKWIVFVCGFILAAIWFFTHLSIIKRYSEVDLSATPLQFNTPFAALNNALNQLWQNAQRSSSLQLPGKLYNLALSIGAVVLSVIFGLTARSSWQEYYAYFHQHAYGLVDPVFGKDISFYLFSLPVLERIHGWLSGLVFVTILAVGWTYFSKNILFVIFSQHSIASVIRKHVGILLSIFVCLMGAGELLNRFDVLFSSQGVVFGAGFTDVKALLPAMSIKSLFFFLEAAFVLVWAFNGSIVFPVVGALAVFLVSILGGSIVPGVVQNYFVAPNEMVKEKPYIARNIRFTREAYGLGNVKLQPFAANNTLSLSDIQANKTAIRNIRLWNQDPLKQTFSQLQEIRLYYEFTNIDVDRYMIDGDIQQVMLSPRELDVNQLTDQAQTWINRHMVYTHGYGAVMSPVNDFTTEGLPLFYMKDLPPVASKGLTITRPEIYFGERTSEYVIANTNQKEFDYPRGDTNVYTHYQGSGGIQLDSFFKRLAFAWSFSDIKILISSLITNESRLMYDRDIKTIVRKLAPFLVYDRDPYMVLTDEGRLVWIQDAYTFSNQFPYSEPYTRGINYIRNSVKVTIDAYSGHVNFYISDKKDPIIKTYASLYTDMFKDISEMPESLQSHVRYPKDMFYMQTSMFRTYHMQDPQVFYNREDLWALPKETYGETEQQMNPYYMVTRLPGEKENSFSLMVPFTPTNKNNMIALMVVNSEPDKYGEITVFKFPKEKTIYGPMQIESRVDQDTDISQNLTLWGQVGSRVIRGNLMVVPIEESLIYVEPIYLQATQSKLPELKRVIFAYDNTITMAKNLDSAISEVFLPNASMEVFKSLTYDDEKASSNSPASMVRLFTVFDSLKDTFKSVDWAGFGKQMEDLEYIINELKKSQ